REASRVLLAKTKKKVRLPQVLSSPQSSTEESPFNLVYDTDTIIPMEIDKLSLRQQQYDEKGNQDCLGTSLYQLVEKQENA
ncbi:hypothetical protein VIGAN_08312200, partial [Vigna angularis var. angularis]